MMTNHFVASFMAIVRYIAIVRFKKKSYAVKNLNPPDFFFFLDMAKDGLFSSTDS